MMETDHLLPNGHLIGLAFLVDIFDDEILVKY
jgi:hypothetical protein